MAGTGLLNYSMHHRDLNCYLTEDDIKSLKCRLSDNIVQFFGELLENNCKSKDSSVNVKFIHPVASNALREFPQAVLDYHLFTDDDWVLCPIHNSDALDRTGNHWSLLVIAPKLNLSLYVDSLLPNKVNLINRTKEVSIAMQNNDIICSHFKWHTEFRIIPSVQQADVSSCGIYVIFNMMLICDYLLKNDLSWVDSGLYNWIGEKTPEDLRGLLNVEIQKYLKDRQNQ
ncbi:hypothetical protein Aperf_G00000062387 [Anoplocephala perfoliata]